MATFKDYLRLVLQETEGEVENDDDAAELQLNYSGRGMFGRTCPAIVGSEQACKQFLMQAISVEVDQLTQMAFEADDDSEEAAAKVEEIKDNVMTLIRWAMQYKVDSMGYGVVFYWPEFSWD